MRTLILDSNGGWLSVALSGLTRGAADPDAVVCATGVEAEEALGREGGAAAVFIHVRPDDGARDGASSACLNLMLAGPTASYPRIVLYGFEEERRVSERCRKTLGVDLLSLTGVQFLRLPALAERLRRVRDEIRAAPPLGGQAVEAELSGVRRRLLEKIWTEFGHDCRNLAQAGEDWGRFKEELEKLLPTFEASVKRFEHYLLESYTRARHELHEIAKSESDSFERLYAHFSKIDGGGAATPATKAAASAGAIKEQAAGAHAPALTGNVMLVEDNEEFAAEVKDALEAAGHKVKVITDVGADSKKIIKGISRNSVTVLLLDLNFGSVENGFVILAEVKRNHPDVKVSVLTGYGGMNRVKAKALRADRYLIKPVAPADIARTVTDLLARRRVLLIDDHVCEVATPDFIARFAAEGCLVLTYADPDDALAALRAGKPNPEDLHLVLLDLKFGESFEHGYEAFKSLKTLRRDLPVFILSGYDSEEVIHNVTYGVLDNYFEPPRDNFIVKPLSNEGWAAIWAALFRDPDHLRLNVPAKKMQLLRAGGGLLAEAELSEKLFIMLLALAYKRQQRKSGIVSRGLFPLDGTDEELNRAELAVPRSLLKEPFDWTGQGLADCRRLLNKSVKEALGFEWSIVTTAPYALNTLIERVTIEH